MVIAAVLESFAQKLIESQAAIKEGEWRLGTVIDLVSAAQKGLISREGDIGRGVVYEVHGIGCRFTGYSGWEVDVDVEENGRCIFDSWRLLNHAESLGLDDGLREVDIMEFCREMVERGVIFELGSGWYSLDGA